MEAINTTVESKFYTANGWEGSKHEMHKGAKEVAKELREYIKKDPELNACKWSITSKWGMTADILTVSLMAAPFNPFTEEYKKRHEYRFERGYSGHGTLSDYTSKPALKVIKKVQAFVMQYIHDDSDGMIDYFDRNIYDKYEIGKFDKPFQLIEAKQTKESNKNENKPVTVGLFEIVDYSEKAVAVFGDTKLIKDDLKELGGRFNPSLNYNGEKRAGWVFSKKQADKVKELITPTELPALPEIETSKDNIIEWKEIPGCGYEGIELEYVGKGNEHGCIGRCDNGTYWGAFGGVQGSTSGLAPAREVFDNETDLLNWMKASGFVYKKKLENINFTGTGEFNGVCCYTVEGAGIITSAKVRADIQPGDVFNVYTAEERKYCVTYDGVSVESSLKNDLPDIIEFNDKIELGTLSVSSFYTPMAENVEFHEKKITGKRYIAKDKPKGGFYHVIDTLDNCPVSFYLTKEEAGKEAETLNGFTDNNGRLKSVI